MSNTKSYNAEEVSIIEKESSVVLKAGETSYEFRCMNEADIEDLQTSDVPEEDMKKRIIDMVTDELEASGVEITDDTFDELVNRIYEKDAAIWSGVKNG